MTSFVSFLIIGLCFGASLGEVAVEEGVLVLTTDNFEGAIAEHSDILVEFYAPWCGHCKALAPEYAKAAQTLADEGSAVKLGKVDATVETELGTKYGVRGYPTLKFFRDGEAVEYGGGRKADDIITWLKKKTGPPATALSTTAEADTFKSSADVVVVGYFADADSDKANTFASAAKKTDSVQFGIVSDASVASHLGMDADSIVVFQNFDDGKAVFDGSFEVEAITKFVADNQLPLVNEFTQESASKIFGGSITKHLLLFISKESSDFSDKLSAMKENAVAFKGQLLFIFINIDDADNDRILEFFGLKKDECPSLRMISLDDNMMKYKPDTDEISGAAIKQFVQDFLDGKLKPHLMSAEEPEDWNAAGVKVLVGKKFNDRVKESGKGVFVEFYAPWCGHCKALAPIWDELGEKYADSADHMIAKVDATANEIDGVKVSSFPTLKYFPKDGGDIVDYSGERTLEAFVKFLDAGGVQTDAGGDDEAESEETGDEPHMHDEV